MKPFAVSAIDFAMNQKSVHEEFTALEDIRQHRACRIYYLRRQSNYCAKAHPSRGQRRLGPQTQSAVVRRRDEMPFGPAMIIGWLIAFEFYTPLTALLFGR